MQHDPMAPYIEPPLPTLTSIPKGVQILPPPKPAKVRNDKPRTSQSEVQRDWRDKYYPSQDTLNLIIRTCLYVMSSVLGLMAGYYVLQVLSVRLHFMMPF